MDSKLNKHIDAKVKQSFDEFQKQAPSHLWEKISDQLNVDQVLDLQIDEKIQDTYSDGIKATAPSLVWDGIEKELEVDANLDALVDEKVKGSFEANIVQRAPRSLWSSISDDLDTQMPPIDSFLDKKVKASFLKQEEIETPNKVWFAINRQLNIDKTWINISKVLDVNPIVSDWRKRMLQFMAVAVVLLFFVRTCDYNPYPAQNPRIVINDAIVNSQNISKKETTFLEKGQEKVAAQKKEQDEIIAGTNSVVEEVKSSEIETSFDYSKKEWAETVTHSKKAALKTKEKEANSSLPSIDLVQKVEFIDNKETKVKEDPSKLILTNSSITKENTDEISNKTENSPTFATENPIANKTNWAILDAIRLGKLSSETDVEPIKLVDDLALTKTTKKNPIEGKLEAGAFIVVNSTMLLNNETREGFDANSLTTNYFGLAANYGIWAAYRITPKGAIVAEFSVNADNKQAYGTYEKGVFYIKEWVMKYNRLSVAYKHDLWSSNSDKLVNTKVVAQGGVYVGVMREAKLFYDGVLVFDKLADYHQFDFGLKVAIGQEILIDKFVIGYGLRSDIGLTNIFRGNVLLNAQENQTNIIHLGGYVLLGYRF